MQELKKCKYQKKGAYMILKIRTSQVDWQISHQQKSLHKQRTTEIQYITNDYTKVKLN